MVASERHPELVKLEQTYPLDNLVLSTPEGRRWGGRMDASEQYFRDYSKDWEENQEILIGFDGLKAKYGTYVALAYAIIQNYVADTYFRNPDPLIQDKGGNRDLSRILTDVFRSVHQQVDSEAKMKDALMDQAWAGFGCVWATFRQEGYPVGDDIFPTKQEIVFKRISPWRIRFDPEGREWDLSDHAYVAVLYFQSLAQVMRDASVSDEDRRRLMAWYTAGARGSSKEAQAIRYASLTTFTEDDPARIRIPIWQVWDRAAKQVIRLPLGASFTLSPQPWPDEFAEADMFPLRYMASNRQPEDETGLQGFIGIPFLRLVRPHIGNVHKLSALFLAANQHVINTYLTPKGALDQAAKDKLAKPGVRQFKVVEYDPSAWAAFPAEMRDKVSPSDLLNLVKQADLKELHHLEGIQHELNMIAQIMGQGSADRGGLSDANTATESLGMQRGLERRLTNAKHVNGKHYNAVSKLFFIILKQRQTLPIRYQMTTTFNEQVWAEFNADALKDLDLHFDYATGSSEMRTREEEFALRERAAGILMPIFQANGDVRSMKKVARDLVEPLNIKETEKYFNDTLQDTMKELVALQRAVGQGLIPADDPRVAARMMELISIAASETLTEQDLAEIVAASAGAPAPAPEGEGSLPSAPSAGEAAARDGAAMGSAAAGMQGGMMNGGMSN